MPKEQHPDVFIIHSGTGKILSLFGFPPNSNEEEYLKNFSGVKDEKSIGEKCTDNLLNPDAAQKIYRFNPEGKIIISLRNPIDVMYSVFTSNLYRDTTEKLTSFAEALQIENTRELESKKNPGKYSPFLFYRKIARYVEQIRRYQNLFDQKNIHFVIFDDLVKKPEYVFSQICRFLDIDSTLKLSLAPKNQIRRTRSNSIQLLVNKMHNTKIRRLASKIPKIQDTYLILNRPKFERPPIDLILKKHLCEELKPEIDELSKLIGRDLSYWCQS